MHRREFLRNSLIGAGISIALESFWIPVATSSEINNQEVKEYDFDDLMLKTTGIKIQKTNQEIFELKDGKNHGIVWVPTPKDMLPKLVEFSRKKTYDCVLVPLSKLSRADIEFTLNQAFNSLKPTNEKMSSAFTYKYKYKGGILSIEPDSIFFISNEYFQHKNKNKSYEYANVVIFEDGIKVYES